MVRKLHWELSPTTRFLLGLAGILALLLLVASLWWLLPAWPRAVFPAMHGTCYEVQISANGQTLIASYENNLAVWDLVRQEEVAVAPYPVLGELFQLGEYEIVLAPDGQSLAIVGCQQIGPPPYVRLWHFTTQPQPITLPDSYGLVEFTADSKHVIVDHGDSKKLWNTATATAQEGDWPLKYLGYPLPDGRTVVIESDTEKGWLVDRHRTEVRIISPDLKTVSEPIVLNIAGSAKPSPDGRLLAVQPGKSNGNGLSIEGDVVTFFDVRTGRELASLPTEQNSELHFSPDGSLMVTSGFQGQTIWDVTSMPPRRVGSLKGCPPTFSADGRWISVEHITITPKKGSLPDVENECEIFHAATLEKEGPTLHSAPILAPNGQSFAHNARIHPSSINQLLADWFPGSFRARASGGLQVRQLPGGREIASFTNVTGLGNFARRFNLARPCCAYFPDGLALAVGHEDGTIEVWDLPPRRPWWIEYGLPALFLLVLLFGGWHCVRFQRKMSAVVIAAQ
jgi:WD40 repeat protein